ncbi:hypothetical protein LQG66_08495 [Bradyrhizobium ontarionense]|uniref:Uncharacterized protein n=1 Tax=Bradyrhizobium ontarionense TaxID=2898149 RepID=A0ABY3RFU3_9BRAD|nr:hypothetical protein [Bradyrhizobium sp. A19]UFZ06324.1 hypothetical protein LQG66_08495 [Bradyrhizobium sp. A19]
MDSVIQSLEAVLVGFVCALPYIWNERYIPRVLLSAFAPVLFQLLLSWSLRGAWFAVFRDFEFNGDLLLAILGGLCAAQVRLVLARWGVRTERDRGLIDRLSSLPSGLLVLLSLAAAVLATYLAIEATSGLEWGSYAAIVIVIMCAVICLASLYRLKTIAFVWTAAAGGYLGSFAAAVHRDWDIITATASHHHYDYATEMLMLPEYFYFACVGALAAGLMIGFSLITLKLWDRQAVEPAAPSC